MNPNRLSDGYRPDVDIDARAGRQAEMFVHSISDALRDGTGDEEDLARVRAVFAHALETAHVDPPEAAAL
jgi:hypothetical protein